MPPTPRELVTARIAERARRFPEFDLTPLDASSTALARAIDQAAARHWLALVAVLDSRLDQPWANLQPPLQAALLTGAAQLLLLENEPDHAVINDAVEWAKRNVRHKAGGLVNAVLRRLAALREEIITVTGQLDPGRNVLPLHDGRAWRLSEDVFDADPIRRLAQQTSHSEELLSHWMSAHGRETTYRLAWHSLVHPPIVIASGIALADPLLSPHSQPGFFIFTGTHDELVALLAAHPKARVQDPGSARPALSTLQLDPPPNLIVDACAGKGTKTRQLALLHPQARIVAADVDAMRSAVLRESLAGHDRIEVIEYTQLHQFREQADLVLLDVPCSNTGVLARRMEAKYRFSRKSLESIVQVQRQIVADAIPLLMPGAAMLYATCSLEPAENERQIEWLTHWHRFEPVESRLHLPRGLPGDDPAGYADGGFHALLRWRGNG
jgi:16S rRNA (cytosine967-C5)-methyltransferase